MSERLAPSVVVRPARPSDVETICEFIAGLAAYERLEHQLDLCPDRLREHLFGAVPACSALLAEVDGEPIGFALFFRSYSTFRMRPCLYLEDLFVLPERRGLGAGIALLREVAREAVRQGCPRLDWSVLDWNEPAIRFYERQGARVMPDWRVCRLEGDALAAAADVAKS